jgi:NAD+ synthase
MTMLFAVSQTFNGRVANTCNLSEDFVGYATLFGDAAGSFAPLSQLTVTEIYQIGDYLGLPYEWVHKVPDDGLPHSSPDEEKFGFSYAELDKYIRENIEPEGKCNNSDELKIDKIRRMHMNNKFKTEIVQIPCYWPEYGFEDYE